MIKYFLYSDEQIKEKNTILSKQSKVFVPGTVTVSGKRIKFTQLATSSDALSRFVDAKIVASGEISKFTYVMPSSTIRK